VFISLFISTGWLLVWFCIWLFSIYDAHTTAVRINKEYGAEKTQTDTKQDLKSLRRAFTNILLAFLALVLLLIILVYITTDGDESVNDDEYSDSNDDGGTNSIYWSESTVDEGCPDGFFKDVKKYDEKLEECGIKSELYVTSEEWDKLKSLSLECKEYGLNAIATLEKLKGNTTSDKCLEEINAFILLEKADNSEREYWYYSAKAREYMNKQDYDIYTFLTYFESEKLYNDEHFYYLYILKREYPQNYYLSLDDEKIYIEITKQRNQFYNQLYDDYYNDYDAKYFLQVNANDPTVIYQTDKLTDGLGGDDNKIRWEIFNFVRNNIEYKYDPNWKTDWVQSPSLTFFSGKGDCDDHAVLLASMFMRAGIDDVKLCSGDSHAWVSAGGYGYDATCKSCKTNSMPPNDLKGECHEINAYREKIGKCNDGTEFGDCSSLNVGYYCDYGELISWCEECGCRSGYYCFEDKCVTCPSGTVLYEDGRCRRP